MLERVLIVVALITVVLAAARAARAVARRKAGVVLDQELPSGLVARLRGNDAGIIFFHGAHCGDCRTQAAILSRLACERGVTITPVDSAHEPEFASALAVLTVPSTVIVDRARRVRAVNLGFRGREALEGQLSGLM